MSSVLDLVQQLQSQLDASQLPLASLAGETFDLEAFLKQCTASKAGSGQVMKTLETELTGYLQASQAQVDSLIHQDFESLLKVPKGLKDFDARVTGLESKLNTVLSALSVSLARLESNKDTAVQLTAELKQLTLQERDLEARIYVIESVESVGKLLCGQMCNAVLERMARIASGCLEKLQFSPELKPEIDSIFTRVKEVLETALNQAWKGQNQRQIHCLLRCFRLIRQESRAMELIRSSIVAPIVHESLDICLSLKSSRPDSSLSLAVFYKKLSQEMVTGGLQCLLSASTQHPCLLSQCLWPEIQEALSSQRSLFSPTFPLEFRINFNETLGFLAGLREKAGKEEQQRLALEGGLKPFLEKWNLPAYFVTRQNEVIKTLQTKLAASGDLKRLFLEAEKPSTVFMKALDMLWSADYYIPYLLPRFLRLHFQVLSRYITLISKSNTKDGLNATILKELLMDVQGLTRYLQTSFQAAITVLKAPMVGEVVAESVGLMAQISHPTTSSYIQIVVQQCSDNLLSLRSIPTIYKMTGRPRPTAPSPFVDSFLRPLIESEKIINDAHMLHHMAESIAQTFSKVLSEVLEAICKYEQMFSKLKDTGESSHADGDKMRIQLRLDASSFLVELQQWGVTSDSAVASAIQQLIAS